MSETRDRLMNIAVDMMNLHDSQRYVALTEEQLVQLPTELLQQWQNQLKTWCDRLDVVMRKRKHPELFREGAAILESDRRSI